ncbi:prenyltransferase [Aliidiomarina soli]|uniref:1,4-dihydroxy-2-naphthoate prenyltransferase n=1 Tax=Aliidiomarina soli TaxID=1928574 RepID=A0A432WF64_9GAMM|nr:prenyltransferase [Aliidiomarina soli]RUO32404.1 1,4-dihydroxy-2-naphthoate prenyltransferase [Aliidiomarina soli]
MNRVFAVARPGFLTLTLVCIALALAFSLQQGSLISLWDAILVVVIGLAAHVSVNAFNEYFDFKSGLDFKTRPTPFSGGSGTLVAAPHLASAALLIAVTALLLVSAGGLYLVWQHGVALLLIGLPGVLIIYAYTQYLNRSPLACLLAPGIGFGLLMTLGAIWVFSATLSAGAWTLATIMTLLVSNLLLLNQFPDIEADASVGRRHLPIVAGRRISVRVFAVLHWLAVALLPLAVGLGWLPVWSLLGLCSLVLLVPLTRGVLRYALHIPEHVRLLGLNVAFVHLYPLLITVGLLVDR